MIVVALVSKMGAAYQLHVACPAVSEVFQGIQSILVDGEGHPMEVGLTR